MTRTVTVACSGHCCLADVRVIIVPSFSTLMFSEAAVMTCYDEEDVVQHVKHRNAIRRGVLSSLDEAAEIAHEQAVLEWRRYQHVVDQQQDVRRRIYFDVLAELRALYGPDYGNSFGSHLVISMKVAQRFHEYLESIGVHRPPRPSRPRTILTRSD